MTLLSTPYAGVFTERALTPLPCKVTLLGGERVALDGRELPLEGGGFLLPEGLAEGRHTVAVDGKQCEGVTVKKGAVRPTGVPERTVVSLLLFLSALENRVCALEAREEKRTVDWLI